MKLPTLSFQPITLQKKYDLETQTDLILDRLHALGVHAIEGGPSDPVEFKKKLDARGMRFSGNHIALSAKPDVAKLIDYTHKAGGADVCNSGVLSWDKPGPDVYRQSIDLLNDMGRQLRREGIRLHYHNHAFEFDKVDGEKTGMDLLLAGLDAEAVDLCVDVAWVYRGNADPATFLKQHAARVGYIHLKDTTRESWKEIGTGELQWPGIVEAIKSLPHVSFAAIEQDKVEIEPWESVGMSRGYLKSTFGW